MSLAARLFVIGIGLVLFLFVVRLVRRRSMGLEYSVLWLTLIGVAVLAGVAQKQADAVSRWIGIAYPPALFFLLCIVVLVAIVLHLTVRLSRLSEAHRALAQEIAILQARRDDAPSASGDERGGPAERDRAGHSRQETP